MPTPPSFGCSITRANTPLSRAGNIPRSPQGHPILIQAGWNTCSMLAFILSLGSLENKQENQTSVHWSEAPRVFQTTGLLIHQIIEGRNTRQVAEVQ